MKKKFFLMSLFLVSVTLFFIWLFGGDSFVVYLPKLAGYFCVFLLFVFIVSGTFSGPEALNKSRKM